MGRGRDHPAILPVAFENEAQGLLGRGVEGRGRLVQEPDGPVRHQQPGQRHPAALARREIGHGQAGCMGQPHRLKGIARLQGRMPKEVAGEGEILLGCQRGLQRIAMTDVVQALGQGPLAGIVQKNRSACGVQTPGQDVEEGGFAGPVAAGDHQSLAGQEREGNALEDAPLAPLAGQIVNAQTQTLHPCPDCTPEPF